ncbi:hypothetical protein AOC05_18180 [Arthrobacter alpinus]|uniref:Helicase-associated domain-containing protein n=1 Tax=Arthrobacter alpinus TaxID=656366 RepID=A0A0M4R143_9MICC|nr:Helicase associated domain protein [Arthrobacter alpinus]ALE93802.1 hypothetical protein AOC05_18180 [Arthrobacter alpinus]
MYEAGLTVREIADRCHHKRSTVHRHLQVREGYQPGLRDRHNASFVSRDPDRPTTTWRRRLKDVTAFHAEHNRPPACTGDKKEESLHAWLNAQRLAYRIGALSTPKKVLLDSLPGWSIETRQQQLDQQWHTRLAQLKEYVAATGQLPRYKRFQTELEHTLGVWLHVQHQRRAEKTLRQWRLEALDAALPGWRSRN